MDPSILFPLTRAHAEETAATAPSAPTNVIHGPEPHNPAHSQNSPHNPERHTRPGHVPGGGKRDGREHQRRQGQGKCCLRGCGSAP